MTFQKLLKNKGAYVANARFEEKGINCGLLKDVVMLGFDYNDSSDYQSKKKITEETPFIIIRPTFSTFNGGFKLREGDVMKLGKQTYRIKEMKLKEGFKDRTMVDKNDVNWDKENPVSQYITIPFQINANK